MKNKIALIGLVAASALLVGCSSTQCRDGDTCSDKAACCGSCDGEAKGDCCGTCGGEAKGACCGTCGGDDHGHSHDGDADHSHD